MVEPINGNVDELILGLDIGTTSDLMIGEIMKRFTSAGKGIQNKYLTMLSKRLKWYGKGELKQLFKIILVDGGVDEERVHYQIADLVFEKFKIITLSRTRQIMVCMGLWYSLETSSLESFVSNNLRSFDVNYRNCKGDVLEYLRDQTLINRKVLNYHPNTVIFKNGQYNIETDEFYIYNKEEDFGAWHYFFEVPHEYKEIKHQELEFNDDTREIIVRKERYGCPKFKKAIRMWLSAPFSRIRCRDVFEAIGLCMTLNTGYKTAFMNYGKKDSGKSQFFNIVAFIVGELNLTTTSLQRLSKNEFGTDDQQFKLLNYCPDLGSKKIYDTSILKNATGGDAWMQAELKGGKKFKYKPTSKYWFNANKIPAIEDVEDDAFLERFILFHFCNVFKKENDGFERDFYKDIVDDPNEVQGIIHECIRGLKRLHKRKGFRPEILKHTKHVWNYESNSIYAYISDFCELGRIEKVRKMDLYEDYVEYCRGIPSSPNYFKKELEKFGIIVKRQTHKDSEGKRPELFHGIKLKNHEEKKDKIDDYATGKIDMDRVFSKGIKKEFRIKQDDIEKEYGAMPE